MIQRIKQAYSKFNFCRSITADNSSFVRLMLNSKKNSRHKTADHSKQYKNTTTQYNIHLNNNPRNIYLRTFTGDIDMFYEILWQEVYKNAIENIKGVHTIVDVGANIGMASLFFKQHFSEATIYAIEPDSDNFDILVENLAPEIKNGDIIPVNAALSDTDGTAYLQKTAFAYNSSISVEPVSDIPVRAFTMDTFMHSMMITQIDLLKIDIEGMEEKIFAEDISWLNNINAIVIECHSPAIKQLCERRLIEKNFSVFGSNSQENTTLIWGQKKVAQ